ncbi:MAG: LysM domain-containing protein [Bdellovibrionota bacterium]
MIQRRFCLNQNLMLFAITLFMSACATQQRSQDSSGSTIDEQVQMESMRELEEMEKSSAAVIVEQDLGLLSLHERNEKEALNNLQNELKNPVVASEESEALRLPANEETKIEENNTSNVKVTYKHVQEKYSKEELTQELFDAQAILVQKGDSLSGLAAKHLGNSKEWSRIWALNPNIQNPNTIEIGDKLYMPKSKLEARSLASVETQKKNDNLEKKAEVAVVAPKEVAQAPVSIPVSTPISTPVSTPTSTETAADNNISLTAATASHSTDELHQEHLDLKRARKYKGKEMPETVKRKISSVNDVAPEEESMMNAPQNLSKIISFLGLLLVISVFSSFFFSKDKKKQ